MKEQPIKQAICNIFEELFSLPAKKPVLQLIQSDVADWDSIGHVRLTIALEKQFNVEIPIETSLTFSSVRAIIEYLEKQ